MRESPRPAGPKIECSLPRQISGMTEFCHLHLTRKVNHLKSSVTCKRRSFMCLAEVRASASERATRALGFCGRHQALMAPQLAARSKPTMTSLVLDQSFGFAPGFWIAMRFLHLVLGLWSVLQNLAGKPENARRIPALPKRKA